jgi:hypothetical protein
MTRTDARLSAFLRESNAIEGIHRDPYQHELVTAARFLEMETLTLQDLNNVQQAFAPGHVLRDRPGLDVRVGNYIAPRGGIVIRDRLRSILNDTHVSTSPYQVHVGFEMLHPYTDGNGRTGRILWAWHMRRLGRDPFRLGFLHAFYYQTLEAQG